MKCYMNNCVNNNEWACMYRSDCEDCARDCKHYYKCDSCDYYMDENSKTLKVEISLDDFTEEEKAKGWYRKKFFCPNCDLLIRTEMWSHYMFGMSTVLKTNHMPNYCPNCGVKIIYEF